MRDEEIGNRPGRGRTVRTGGIAVIRQAISCDICGTEKKQTNHWFVAYEQGGELRVSGWSSRNRLRPGSKHLCGQTCLHKLVDDFMAKALSARVAAAPSQDEAEDEVMEQAAGADTSLTSDAAYGGSRVLRAADCPQAAEAPDAAPAASASRADGADCRCRQGRAARSAVLPPYEPPRYASRNWRAEAWERERERELRAGERHVRGMAPPALQLTS